MRSAGASPTSTPPFLRSLARRRWSPVFEIGLAIVRSLVIIFALLTGMAYMTWFERRAISRLQVRIGPNRVGPAGLAQPLADALKLFFKEDVRPAMADRLLYLTAAIAETNRAPFDLPEAEQELVAGYHTEYSGFRFALYYIAEYVNVLTVSAIAATLFFGGWLGPFNLVNGPSWLLLKMTVFAFLFVWLRATLPRLRYD